MEIRRCDKCKIEIDLEHSKDADRWLRDVRALKINLPIPVSSEEKRETQGQPNQLDDRDEFGNNIVIKTIDLCENCVVEFSSMVKVWLANVDIGVP